MAMTFHESSLVIVGTFNIYIIRPDWLGKVGLLPEGSEVKFESQLNQPGFRLLSPALRSKWVVAPTRIALNTDDPNEDCGRTADRILEALPWTPLMAMGFNFVYRGAPDDINGWEAKTAFPSQTPPQGFTFNQRSWHVGLKQGDQLFNLQLAHVPEGIEIRVNVHTDLQEREIVFARTTASKFIEFRRTSVSVIENVFQTRIN